MPSRTKRVDKTGPYKEEDKIEDQMQMQETAKSYNMMQDIYESQAKRHGDQFQDNEKGRLSNVEPTDVARSEFSKHSPEIADHFNQQDAMNKYMEERMNRDLPDEEI